MTVLGRVAGGALWVLAALGLLCGATWAASAVGLIKPLVVISGSMQPEIQTGDLLIATRVDTSSLGVGDVVSLPSVLTGDLVTHRIVTITPHGPDSWTIVLKGDANQAADPQPYVVGHRVWKPALRLSGLGTVVQRLGTPRVFVPLVIGLLALLGLTLLLPAPTTAQAVPDPDDVPRVGQEERDETEPAAETTDRPS